MKHFLILSGFATLIVFSLLYFNSNDTYEDFENFYYDKSKISGIGLFNRNEIMKDEKLVKCISSNRRVTKTGSKINHCWIPNTRLQKDNQDGSWWIYSIQDIKPNTELTVDYRFTPSFIKKPNADWTC
jgi:SET domain-containing protein